MTGPGPSAMHLLNSAWQQLSKACEQWGLQTTELGMLSEGKQSAWQAFADTFDALLRLSTSKEVLQAVQQAPLLAWRAHGGHLLACYMAAGAHLGREG